MAQLPVGVVTFLFTDIEGSTRLVEELGDAYPTMLTRHAQILDHAAAGHRGVRFGRAGDGHFFVFPSAQQATRAAIDAQRELAHPGMGLVRVRMGIHTGEPVPLGDDYTGLVLHETARTCSAAHGGQVIVSAEARHAIGVDLPEDATLSSLGEHRLKDLSATHHLYQLIHPDIHPSFPPPRTLDSLPNNLPTQLSSFVGREKELRDTSAALHGTRLTTLVGPGGAGKTRLAIHVAADVLDRFTDGVRLVELAPVSAVDGFVGAIATACTIPETGNDLRSAVIDGLRRRDTLLVIDNCEHLISEARPFIRDLLHACPRVRVLATSREPLLIEGEVCLPVAPLAHPDPRELPPPETLARYEAVQLFVQRARTHSSGFEITPRNAAAIASICARLDGLPLALELAAARVRLLGVEQIAARLDDRFALLRDRTRAESRQQTLHALVAWSIDLLSEPEHAALRRLSVFAGPFEIDAAEAVLKDLGDGLELVGALVDRSLVQVERDDVRARYRILETIREFAAGSLEEDEARIARRAHRDAFVAFADHERWGEGMPAGGWLARIGANIENFRSALAWCEEHRDPIGLRVLGLTVSPFLNAKGLYTEQRRWLETALTTDDIPVRQHLDLLYEMADNLGKVSRLEEAAKLLERGVDLATESNMLDQACRFIGSLASTLANRGETARAEVLHRQALEMARSTGDRGNEAAILTNLSLILDDHLEAIEMLESARVIAEEMGLRQRVATVHQNLGWRHRARGARVEARQHFAAALAIYEGLGIVQSVALAHLNLGALAWDDGDPTTAREHWDLALSTYRSIEAPLGIARCLYNLAMLERGAGNLDRASAMLREGLDRWRAIEDIEGELYSLVLLGQIAMGAGDFPRARSWLEHAVTRSVESHEIQGAVARLFLALVECHEGKVADARAIIDEALAVFRLRHEGPSEADALGARGEIMAAGGDEADAIASFREAIAHESAKPETIAGCLGNLALLEDEPERACVLLGASATLRRTSGIVLYPSELPTYEATVGALRQKVGELYEPLHRAGEALSMSEAIALGLGGPLPTSTGSSVAIDAAMFSRSGELWSLSFGGDAVSVADAKGLTYLARLLARPGLEVHAVELAAGGGVGAAAAQELDGVEADAGPMLDQQAIASIKERVRDLEEDAVEAESFGDQERAARARAEMAGLTEHLAKGLGLGGRARKVGDPAERARKAVTNRIRDAITRIDAVHPPLGAHLRNAVRTGVFCSYQPERPIDWDVRA